MRKLAKHLWLGVKELRSFLHDFVLLGLVAYAFSLAVTLQAGSNSQELHNASIAIVDETTPSFRGGSLMRSFPRCYQTPKLIAERDIIPR